MTMTPKKHVLIIDGFPPPHFWLLEKGYRITWLISVDRIRDRKGYTRIIGMSLDASRDEWVNIAKAIHDIDPFDCILNFSELHQDKTALIAKTLNLKWHRLDVIEVVNNKLKMREKINQSGIHSFRYKQINNAEMLFELLEEWKTSIILKPKDSFGSQGIYEIHNINDARYAWESFTKLNYTDALAEELLVGEEYSVEAFSENGKHHIVGITNKYKNKKFVEIGHSFPALIDSNTEKVIMDYTQKILTILGVEDGVTHTEIIVTSTGPVIVETHLRLGGDYIPDLVKESIGIDLVDTWMSSIVADRKFNHKPLKKEKKYAAVWFKENDLKGEVKDVGNVDNAKNIKGVLKVELMKNIGDLVDSTSDSSSRLCLAIAVANSPESAISIAKQAVNEIKFDIVQKD